jgi:hypothetical protein
MKFIAPLLAFATAVCAQSIYIPYPADGATLIAGQKTTIEIELPVSGTFFFTFMTSY